jgi:DNA-binding CsgD family transcriptional regulator
MPDHAGGLRPIERVITRLRSEGASVTEIGRRVGKKPGTVTRIIAMIDFKQGAGLVARDREHSTRPIERVVARLRANGESYGEIGNRLAKSGRRIRHIEGYARLREEA